MQIDANPSSFCSCVPQHHDGMRDAEGDALCGNFNENQMSIRVNVWRACNRQGAKGR